LEPAAFCLGFAARQADIARCVIGVDTPEHLSQLILAFEAGLAADISAENLLCHEDALIDPRFWECEA